MVYKAIHVLQSSIMSSYVMLQSVTFRCSLVIESNVEEPGSKPGTLLSVPRIYKIERKLVKYVRT